MNNKESYQITPLEMSITIVSTLFSTGILTLPNALANRVGTADGWISVLIGGVFIMVFVIFYVRLQRHFPGQTLFQFIGDGPLGKWVAKLLTVLFLLYLFTIISVEVRIFAIALKMYLLDRTPAEVIVALMLLLITYAVSKGVQGLIHLHLLFTPIIASLIILLILANLGNMQFDQLLPVMPEGILPILQGSKITIYSFAAIFILYVWMAYMQPSDFRALPLNIGVGVVTVFYMLIIVFNYGVFSFEATKYITFPTIELAKEVDIPGGFLERAESLMITGWVMSIFTTIALIQMLIIYMIREQFLSHVKNTSWLPPVTIFIIFILAFIPNSIVEIKSLIRTLDVVSFFFLLITLSCGFITLWARNRKRGKHVWKN